MKGNSSFGSFSLQYTHPFPESGQLFYGSGIRAITSTIVVPFLVIPFMCCLNDRSIPFLSIPEFSLRSCFRCNTQTFQKSPTSHNYLKNHNDSEDALKTKNAPFFMNFLNISKTCNFFPALIGPL
jgi:hypothetical protein